VSVLNVAEEVVDFKKAEAIQDFNYLKEIPSSSSCLQRG